MVPTAKHAPIRLCEVFWVNFSWPVNRGEYLVLSKFDECRAICVLYCANSYLYLAVFVYVPPVCSLSIFIYQISCLSHFSSTPNSSSTSPAVPVSSLGGTTTGACEASCGGGVSGTFNSIFIRCVKFAV